MRVWYRYGTGGLRNRCSIGCPRLAFGAGLAGEAQLGDCPGWALRRAAGFWPRGAGVLEQRLRDALLSKLIRGEIRVKEAERFLKEMEERGL